MAGRCSKKSCKDLHPPFDPAGDWTDASREKAWLWPGAPLWHPALPPAPPRVAPAAELAPQLPPPPLAPQPRQSPYLPPATVVAPAAVQQPQMEQASVPAAGGRGWNPFHSLPGLSLTPVAAAALAPAASQLSPNSRLLLPTAIGQAHLPLPRAPALPALQQTGPGGQAGGMAGPAAGEAEEEEELLQLLQVTVARLLILMLPCLHSPPACRK